MSWAADIWNWAGEQGPLVNILEIMSSMGGAGARYIPS